jgi:hypothetical protein
MESNNSENLNPNKLDQTIIPFSYRKSQILSIIFRSLDFNLGKYRLKIESDGDSLPKKEFYSTFTDTTLVRNFYFNLIIGSKISIRL